MSSAPAVVPAVAAANQPDTLTQIRNEYQTRFLVVQALIALDLQQAALAANTISKWAADSVTKGTVDPAATLAVETAWKTANDQILAQEQSLRDMEGMLEKQIDSYKSTNPARWS
jgi:hypothetical protein